VCRNRGDNSPSQRRREKPFHRAHTDNPPFAKPVQFAWRVPAASTAQCFKRRPCLGFLASINHSRTWRVNLSRRMPLG
jgi:hypothetical protein